MALLLARLGLAGLFLYAGWEHLWQLDGFSTTIQKLGYPAPRLMAALAIAALLGGGLSLVLGALLPLGCLALIAFLASATYSVHVSQALAGGQAAHDQLVQSLKNLGLLGGLIALFLAGPGGISVDARVFRRGRKG